MVGLIFAAVYHLRLYNQYIVVRCILMLSQSLHFWSRGHGHRIAAARFARQRPSLLPGLIFALLLAVLFPSIGHVL
jgi:hypothetical protein